MAVILDMPVGAAVPAARALTQRTPRHALGPEPEYGPLRTFAHPIHSVFDYLRRPWDMAGNLLEAAINIYKGDPWGEDAESALRNAIGLIPFSQQILRPIEKHLHWDVALGRADETTGREVLDRISAGDWGHLSDLVPGIFSETGAGWKFKKGDFWDITGKGVGGLTLEIGFDPITYATGFGMLTKAGRKALRKGELIADWGAAGKAGHRAMLSMFGRPLLTGQSSLRVMQELRGVTRGLTPEMARKAASRAWEQANWLWKIPVGGAIGLTYGINKVIGPSGIVPLVNRWSDPTDIQRMVNVLVKGIEGGIDPNITLKGIQKLQTNRLVKDVLNSELAGLNVKLSPDVVKRQLGRGAAETVSPDEASQVLVELRAQLAEKVRAKTGTKVEALHAEPSIYRFYNKTGKMRAGAERMRPSALQKMFREGDDEFLAEVIADHAAANIAMSTRLIRDLAALDPKELLIRKRNLKALIKDRLEQQNKEYWDEFAREHMPQRIKAADDAWKASKMKNKTAGDVVRKFREDVGTMAEYIRAGVVREGPKGHAYLATTANMPQELERIRDLVWKIQGEKDSALLSQLDDALKVRRRETVVHERTAAADFLDDVRARYGDDEYRDLVIGANKLGELMDHYSLLKASALGEVDLMGHEFKAAESILQTVRREMDKRVDQLGRTGKESVAGLKGEAKQVGQFSKAMAHIVMGELEKTRKELRAFEKLWKEAGRTGKADANVMAWSKPVLRGHVLGSGSIDNLGFFKEGPFAGLHFESVFELYQRFEKTLLEGGGKLGDDEAFKLVWEFIRSYGFREKYQASALAYFDPSEPLGTYFTSWKAMLDAKSLKNAIDPRKHLPPADFHFKKFAEDIPELDPSEALSELARMVKPDDPEEVAEALSRKWNEYVAGKETGSWPEQVRAVGYRPTAAEMGPKGSAPWQMTKEEFGKAYFLRGVRPGMPKSGAAERADKFAFAREYSRGKKDTLSVFRAEDLPKPHDAATEITDRLTHGANPIMELPGGIDDPHKYIVEQAAKQGNIGRGIENYPDLLAKYGKKAEGVAAGPFVDRLKTTAANILEDSERYSVKQAARLAQKIESFQVQAKMLPKLKEAVERAIKQRLPEETVVTAEMLKDLTRNELLTIMAEGAGKEYSDDVLEAATDALMTRLYKGGAGKELLGTIQDVQAQHWNMLLHTPHYLPRLLTDEGRTAFGRAMKITGRPDEEIEAAFSDTFPRVLRFQELSERTAAATPARAVNLPEKVPHELMYLDDAERALKRWIEDHGVKVEGRLFERDPMVIADVMARRTANLLTDTSIWSNVATLWGIRVAAHTKDSRTKVMTEAGTFRAARKGEKIAQPGHLRAKWTEELREEMARPHRDEEKITAIGEKLDRLMTQEAEYFNMVDKMGGRPLSNSYARSKLGLDLQDTDFEVIFPGWMADALDRYADKITPKEINKFVRGLDWVMGWWKAQALLGASFPVGNWVSEHWINHTAGWSIWKPEVLSMEAKAIQLRRVLGNPMKASEKYVMPDGRRLTIGQAADEVNELMVQRAGRVARELSPELEVYTFQRESVHGVPKWMVKYNPSNVPITKQWRQANEFIEDVPRLTHYMLELKHGATPAEAARQVRYWHYDYSDLTEQELRIGARLIPFIVWTRKNIPQQVVNLMTQPGRFQNLDDIRRAMSGGTLPTEGTVPEWIEDRGPVRVGEKVFPIERMIPAYDINVLKKPAENLTLKGRAVHKFMEMFNPWGIVSPGWNMMANWDPYFQRQIQEAPGEREKFAGVYAPKKLVYAMRQFRPLREFGGLLPSSRPEYEELPMSEKLFRLGTGVKLYSYPMDRLAERELRGVQDQRRRIVRDMRRASLAQDFGEVERLGRDLRREQLEAHERFARNQQLRAAFMGTRR